VTPSTDDIRIREIKALITPALLVEIEADAICATVPDSGR